MPRGHFDLSKEKFWRRTLRLWQRHHRRGGTTREFCEQHHLSEPLFYAWRRTLAERDHAKQSRSVPTTRRASPKTLPLFIPLNTSSPPPTQPLELVLASGHTLRVSVGFDADTLRQLLALLKEMPSC